ncbi:hypothetical protein BD410DRAFT_830559 [Rickenella mellea]|uniref:Fungal-type protein kinase domain-containing protein n=1 Tax=Rickenella mellea TaxID=50990 RepID=A0A4Y7PU76_9AGAM|nr:hypothetical protein BD410DRAFT_830559 [Rickenella mellea]
MRYNDTIKRLAALIGGLGDDAREAHFHVNGLYNGILNQWFPTVAGYVIEPQVQEDGVFMIVRHLDASRRMNSVLVVELKGPTKYNATGKRDIQTALTARMEKQFQFGHTTYGKIYGLGGIGAHWIWMACVKDITGRPTVIQMKDWTDDITSDTSAELFHQFALRVATIEECMMACIPAEKPLKDAFIGQFLDVTISRMESIDATCQ